MILASLIVGIFTPASVLSGRSPTGCPDNICLETTSKCSVSGTQQAGYKCMNGNIPTAGTNADCNGYDQCIPEPE